MIPSDLTPSPECLELFVRKRILSNSKNNDGYSKIPDYAHTRRVLFREVLIDDVSCTVFSCKCYHFKRERCACRHFYAVLDISPLVEHFYPDCLKEYELEYAEDGSELFTHKCDDLIETHDFYGGMVLRTTLDKIMVQLNSTRQITDESFFLEAFNNVLDTNPLQYEDNNNRTMESLSSKKRKKKYHPNDDAYNRFYKRFRDMTAMITHPEQFTIMEKSMNATYRELLSVQKRMMKDDNSKAIMDNENHVTKTNASDSSRLMSLPEMDNRSHDTRKKPFNSPTKFK